MEIRGGALGWSFLGLQKQTFEVRSPKAVINSLVSLLLSGLSLSFPLTQAAAEKTSAKSSMYQVLCLAWLTYSCEVNIDITISYADVFNVFGCNLEEYCLIRRSQRRNGRRNLTMRLSQTLLKHGHNCDGHNVEWEDLEKRLVEARSFKKIKSLELLGQKPTPLGFRL